MSGKKLRKLRDRLAREVIDGDLTVAAAQARLGGAAAVQKSAGAAWTPAPGPQVPRYPGDENYVRSAFRPLPRPVVTAAAPAPRESPLQSLAILKAAVPTAPGTVRPMRAATSAELATLRAMERITDPGDREKMRSGLMAQMEGVTL
jgi:hypothetical protein